MLVRGTDLGTFWLLSSPTASFAALLACSLRSTPKCSGTLWLSDSTPLLTSCCALVMISHASHCTGPGSLYRSRVIVTWESVQIYTFVHLGAALWKAFLCLHDILLGPGLFLLQSHTVPHGIPLCWYSGTLSGSSTSAEASMLLQLLSFLTLAVSCLTTFILLAVYWFAL